MEHNMSSRILLIDPGVHGGIVVIEINDETLKTVDKNRFIVRSDNGYALGSPVTVANLYEMFGLNKNKALATI
jgi:hypothetical protein